MLGKLSVPGRPTSLDDSRARAYCACSRCGWGLFGHFSRIYLYSFLSPSLWETAQYRLKYCLKGPLNPKQPTNQSKPSSRRCAVDINGAKVTNPGVACLITRFFGLLDETLIVLGPFLLCNLLNEGINSVPRRLFCFGSLVILDVARCYLWIFTLYINIKIGKNSC